MGIEAFTASVVAQYGTRLWYSNGAIIYLLPPSGASIEGAADPSGPRWTRVNTSGAKKGLYRLDGPIRAAADPVASPDREEIARFMKVVDDEAARAIGNADRTGYLQLSYLIPDSKMISTRHKIAAIDDCVSLYRAPHDSSGSGAWQARQYRRHGMGVRVHH
jgi:hypothetical protein